MSEAATEAQAVQPNEEVVKFKKFLCSELDNWMGILKDTKERVEKSSDDKYEQIHQNAHSLIRACDREVVYMHKLEEIALQQQAEAVAEAEPVEAQKEAS